MSIYSGFATRSQEQLYDQLLMDLIQVLQRRILKFYIGHEADEHKFNSILNNIQAHLQKMEQNKYLTPKYAPIIQPLIDVTNSISQTTPKYNSQKVQPKQKDSLSFSRERLSQHFQDGNFGKIRHQLLKNTNKAQYQWFKNVNQNPEDINSKQEKQIQKHHSSYIPKSYRSRKWAEKAQKEPGMVNYALEKRNEQYIIRQYMNKSRERQSKKKHQL